MAKSSTAVKPDQMFFFVRESFGRLGVVFRETDPADTSRAQVIKDILSGEIGTPVQVIQCCAAEHICDDITESVAREVYAALQDGGVPCPPRLRDWLDNELGVSAADHLDISTGNFNVQRAAMQIRSAAEHQAER